MFPDNHLARADFRTAPSVGELLLRCPKLYMWLGLLYERGLHDEDERIERLSGQSSSFSDSWRLSWDCSWWERDYF